MTAAAAEPAYPGDNNACPSCGSSNHVVTDVRPALDSASIIVEYRCDAQLEVPHRRPGQPPVRFCNRRWTRLQRSRRPLRTL